MKNINKLLITLFITFFSQAPIANDLIKNESQVVIKSLENLENILSGNNSLAMEISNSFKEVDVLYAKENYSIEMKDNKWNQMFVGEVIDNYLTGIGSNLRTEIGFIKISAYKQKMKQKELISLSLNNNMNICSINLIYTPIIEWSNNQNPKRDLIESLTKNLSYCLIIKNIANNDKITSDLKINQLKNNNISVNKDAKLWMLGLNKNLKSSNKNNPIDVYYKTYSEIFSLIYLYKNNIYSKTEVQEKINDNNKQCLKDHNHCVFLWEINVMDVVNLEYTDLTNDTLKVANKISEKVLKIKNDLKK